MTTCTVLINMDTDEVVKVFLDPKDCMDYITNNELDYDCRMIQSEIV